MIIRFKNRIFLPFFASLISPRNFTVQFFHEFDLRSTFYDLVTFPPRKKRKKERRKISREKILKTEGRRKHHLSVEFNLPSFIDNLMK